VNQDAICNAILDYIRKAVGPAKSVQLTSSSLIYDFIDSYAIVELVSYLSGSLGHEIDFASARTEDLETPRSLAAYLSRQC
jgi:acyl carrier protein